MRSLRIAWLAPLLLLGACGGGGLGALGDVLGTLGTGAPGGAGGQGEINGEVQSVDQGSQRIYLRTPAGESGSVLYDQQTQVVYQQQQYPVTALEPGDLVTVQAQQSGNDLYAVAVHVQQSVQDRGGSTSGSPTLLQLQGVVGAVDTREGYFELRSQGQGTVVVSLPFNVDRTTLDRFQRLRSGDAVALEGYPLNQQRVELYRFR